MDKNLLSRLEKLEEGSDLGDPRTVSLHVLEARVAELMGFVPTTKQLEQFIADQKDAQEPKN